MKDNVEQDSRGQGVLSVSTSALITEFAVDAQLVGAHALDAVVDRDL